MINSTFLSADTVALVAEWHASSDELDPVTTEIAMVHDAIHAWCGLSTTLADEEVVSNVANMLAGLDTSAHLTERCAFIISLLPSDVLVELSIACSHFYG